MLFSPSRWKQTKSRTQQDSNPFCTLQHWIANDYLFTPKHSSIVDKRLVSELVGLGLNPVGCTFFQFSATRTKKHEFLCKCLFSTNWTKKHKFLGNCSFSMNSINFYVNQHRDLLHRPYFDNVHEFLCKSAQGSIPQALSYPAPSIHMYIRVKRFWRLVYLNPGMDA